jgi:hypothetical protein
VTAIQIFSFVGSIIGVATGIFVFVDRLFRYRPIGFVVVKGNRHNAHRYVRVKNAGPVDIIVTDITARPSSFEISTGHSVRELASAIVDKPAVSIVPPEEERDFVFFENPKRPGDKAYAGRVRLAIHWRKASCTWLRQAPVFVRTSTVDLERMESALG